MIYKAADSFLAGVVIQKGLFLIAFYSEFIEISL